MGSQPMPSIAPRKSASEEIIDRLHQCVGRLEDVSNRITNHLAPVSRIQETTIGEPPRAVSQYPEYFIRIQDQIDKANEAMDRIDSALNRSEL